MNAHAVTKGDAHAIVQSAIDATIAAGQEIGIQVCAYHKGRMVIDCWGGLADPDSGRPVDGDTLFNVFSVTKAVAATALHILAERGLIDYDAPVTCYWPDYGAAGKAATTVRHILTHRSGLAQMPEGVTPELMCDWDFMTRSLAALPPLAAPGSKALYQSMTFGWLVGELVRRADPQHRPFGRFVREEIAEPLGIGDLWVGIPDAVESRIARLTLATPPIPVEYLPPLYLASMPPAVDLVPSVFERPEVRRAAIAGVGGIFNARSCARFWAMLAQGGALDSVRLLSQERVAAISQPRADADEPDPVMFGIPMPLTQGGFWHGAGFSPVSMVGGPCVICHPGAGGSIAWADPANHLAVAICHNRMFDARTPEDCTTRGIADAVREALEITG